MSRLSIEISPKQHQHIKARAALAGQSIKEFVMSRLFQDETEEEQSWKEMHQFLNTRIEAANNDAVSDQTISQITKDEIASAGK